MFSLDLRFNSNLASFRDSFDVDLPNGLSYTIKDSGGRLESINDVIENVQRSQGYSNCFLIQMVRVWFLKVTNRDLSRSNIWSPFYIIVVATLSCCRKATKCGTHFLSFHTQIFRTSLIRNSNTITYKSVNNAGSWFICWIQTFEHLNCLQGGK